MPSAAIWSFPSWSRELWFRACSTLHSAALCILDVRQLLREEPRVEQHYLHYVTALLRTVSERIEANAALPVRDRICAELLRRAQPCSRNGAVSCIMPAAGPAGPAELAACIAGTHSQLELLAKLRLRPRVPCLDTAGPP